MNQRKSMLGGVAWEEAAEKKTVSAEVATQTM